MRPSQKQCFVVYYESIKRVLKTKHVAVPYLKRKRKNKKGEYRENKNKNPFRMRAGRLSRKDDWRKCVSGLTFGVFAVGLLAMVTLSASPSRSILAEDAAFQPWQVAISHLGQGST